MKANDWVMSRMNMKNYRNLGNGRHMTCGVKVWQDCTKIEKNEVNTIILGISVVTVCIPYCLRKWANHCHATVVPCSVSATGNGNKVRMDVPTAHCSWSLVNAFFYIPHTFINNNKEVLSVIFFIQVLASVNSFTLHSVRYGLRTYY